MQKFKNVILKSITAAAGYFFLAGMCGFDGSNPAACALIVFIAGAWLTAFTYANGVVK